MKLLLKALQQHGKEQITLAATFVSTRAIAHSSLTPNAIADVSKWTWKSVLSNKILLLLLNAGTIEFTPEIHLPWSKSNDDDTTTVTAILERLKKTQYSRRSLRALRGLYFNLEDHRDFVQNYCEVLEEVHVKWSDDCPSDFLKVFVESKSSRSLRSLIMYVFQKHTTNLILTNLLRHLPFVRTLNLGAESQNVLSISDEEFLEVAYLTRLEKLCLSDIDGVTGKTFGEVFEQLPCLTKVSVSSCADLNDISDISVISGQLTHLAVDIFTGMSEWKKFSFPRLESFTFADFQRYPAEMVTNLEFLKSCPKLQELEFLTTFEKGFCESSGMSAADTFLSYLSKCDALVSFRWHASNGITKTGLQSFLKSPNMKQIELGNVSQIGPDDLLDILPHLPNLTLWGSHHLKIGDANWKAFSQLKQLNALSITNSAFFVSKAVFESTIFESKSLETVSLSFLTNAEAANLTNFNFLRNADRLTSFHFHGPSSHSNSWVDSEVPTSEACECSPIDVSGLLQSALTLESFELGNCSFVVEPMIALISELEVISYLFIASSATDDVIDAIAKNASIRETLSRLTISGGENLTKASFPALKIILNTERFSSLAMRATPEWGKDFVLTLVEEKYRDQKIIHHNDLYF
jgi:hypothetical protein